MRGNLRRMEKAEAEEKELKCKNKKDRSQPEL